MRELLLSLLLPLLLAGLLTGAPAALAIAGAPLLVALAAIAAGLIDAHTMLAWPQRIMGVMASPTYAAIPLFVLMGAVLERSGLAADMLAAMARLAGGRPRPLALAVLAVAALIAASTGVAGATIVLLATVALPGMLAAGMTRRASAGLICAAGTLGQIIPPSILLVLLAEQTANATLDAARASGRYDIEPVGVAQLFAGCVLPGLLLVALYALWLLVAPAGPGDAAGTVERAPEQESAAPVVPAGASLLAFLAPVILILSVLGAMLTGLATPTEAAGLGAGGAIVLALVRRGPAGLRLGEAFMASVTLTGAILFIVLAASLFSLVFRALGGDGDVARLLGSLPGGAGTALLAVMALVFLLGFVLEFVEIVTLVVPIAGPALFAAGVDPLWFAVALAVLLQTSFLTPPFGLALFYFRAAAPAGFDAALIARAIVPYVGLQVVAVVLVWLVPALATGLPRALF